MLRTKGQEPFRALVLCVSIHKQLQELVAYKLLKRTRQLSDRFSRLVPKISSFSALLTLAFFFVLPVSAEQEIEFTLQEPIDVVIPCISRDAVTLDLCISGIRNNCKQVRRIITISSEPLTTQAEWFDEKRFPFNFYSVAFHILDNRPLLARAYLEQPGSRIGWYYQQLLKLYAAFVIPGISSNILMLDADTVFFRPVSFIDSDGYALFNTSNELHLPYFAHAESLLPGLKKVFSEHSGVAHHMLFQRHVLVDLFSEVESFHKKSFWKVFCESVTPCHIFAGASEYEIYFNYLFSHGYPAKIRPLKMRNSGNLDLLDVYIQEGLDYVSFHAWLRGG